MPTVATCFDYPKLARLRRELCDREGIIPETFCSRVPISYPYLLRIETGGNAPSLRMIEQLANALGIAPAELLTDTREGAA